jgi:hypothetical protein
MTRDVLVSFSTIVVIWSSSMLTTWSINVGVCFCTLDFFKSGLLSNMWPPLVLLYLKGYRTHSKRSSRWVEYKEPTDLMGQGLPLHILITLEEITAHYNHLLQFGHSDSWQENDISYTHYDDPF